MNSIDFAKPEAKYLIIGTIFLAVGSSMSLIYPQAVRSIIDQALTTKDQTAVNRWAIIILSSLVTKFGCYTN